MPAAWGWLKREGGKYKDAMPQAVRHSNNRQPRKRRGLCNSVHSRSVATPSTGYIHGRDVRTSRKVIHSGEAPSSHLDGLDLKVEGDQGKDKALQDGAQRGSCGPEVVKLAFRSCTR